MTMRFLSLIGLVTLYPLLRENMLRETENKRVGARAGRPLLRGTPPARTGAWRMEELAEGGPEKERRVRGGNISVVVRARPLSHDEEARGLYECIRVDTDGKHLVVLDPDDKMGGLDYLRLDRNRSTTYAFDRSLGPEVTQSQTFDASASALVGSILAGRNACCFAYGATGSGKTFTMTGSEEQPGLVTRTLDALFDAAHATGDQYYVTCQYVEIYNETIKDLLCPSNGLLDVREGAEGTFVAGAASLTVHSREEVQALISEGNNERATEATLANAVSSRSHAVLQLRVDVAGGVSAGRHSGKLSMIDLAGSERCACPPAYTYPPPRLPTRLL